MIGCLFDPLILGSLVGMLCRWIIGPLDSSFWFFVGMALTAIGALVSWWGAYWGLQNSVTRPLIISHPVYGILIPLAGIGVAIIGIAILLMHSYSAWFSVAILFGIGQRVVRHRAVLRARGEYLH